MSSASGKDSSGDAGHEDWMRSGLNADSPSRSAPPPVSPGRTAPPYEGDRSADGARSRRSRRAAIVVALLLLVALLTIVVLVLT
jgi:hypothetical protein